MKKRRKTIDTELLKEIADIETVIEATGERYKVKGNYINVLCPFHSDHNMNNAMFRKDTKHFHCYACDKRADLISYTQAVMGMNFQDACEFIADACCITDDEFTKDREDPVKLLRRKNSQKFAQLRIDGQQKKLYRGESFNSSQVPDGCIINFTSDRNEADDYQKKGYSLKKCWQEDEKGLVYLAGYYIYKKMPMSTAKFMMSNPEICSAMMNWKKSEILAQIHQKEEFVENNIFDKEEYDQMMQELKQYREEINTL